MSYLESWRKQQPQHEVEIFQGKKHLSGGDILFLISCSEYIDPATRLLFSKTLVIHASDLPNGRGWSPHIWQIIEGQTQITVCLLEAEDIIDSGDIWKKISISIPKYALWDEINHLLFNTELELMNYAVENFDKILPQAQVQNTNLSHYKKRTPRDSQINIDKNIRSQFDLIRTCDPDRYPAFFEIHGHKYIIKLEKND